MSGYLLLKVASSVVGAVVAAAVVSRDPRLRVNWLTGAIGAAAAWWAFCEFAWNSQTDPGVAVIWLRLSSVGWLSLGAVGLHLFCELQGHRSRLRRWIPWSYAAYAAAAAIYNLTPLCVESVSPVAWGWEPQFGPLFLLIYGVVAIPVGSVFATWRDLYPSEGSKGEKRGAIGVFAAVGGVMTWASVNEVVLPLLGYAVPRHGSLVTTLGCLGVAWVLRRYGFSLLSPGAFAHEILASLHDGLALLLEGGEVREANEALERLVGAEPGALRDAKVDEFLPLLDAGSLAFGTVIDTSLRTRSGEHVPVSVTFWRLPQLAGIVQSTWGEALVVSDLREVTALRGRLLSSARLAAVGELSAGISEEISRPIRDASESLSRLREPWAELAKALAVEGVEQSFADVFAEGEELIEECLEGVGRVDAILQDVRRFATGRGASRKTADLNQIVENAMRLAERWRRPGVAFVLELGEVPPLVCSAGELEQVLVNLVINAVHAVGEEGTITVRTRYRDGKVFVEVIDDGSGISEEVADRIFDPFFTTKPVGEGTGLGLSICLRIVRSHGGDVSFETTPGEGTAFRVRLPASR